MFNLYEIAKAMRDLSDRMAKEAYAIEEEISEHEELEDKVEVLENVLREIADLCDSV